ncbi:CHAT domain-containing protein [Tahibacter sp. P2K]|uniref:CHAT domain-containing protein n=2 Tax=Tahibacter harae TaxID=2963937 RepID=A0ABT1QKS3_9GAMM|nr:CHAT domain-containing protein [Tahibacter harae]
MSMVGYPWRRYRRWQFPFSDSLAALLVTVVALLADPAAAAAEPVLVAGSQVARTIVGDGEDQLLIDASAGPLVVVVEQLGVDLLPRCDNEAHARNSPSGPWSSEVLVVPVRCLLSLRARSVGAPALSYRARAFTFDSPEGRRWQRPTWELWSQAHYENGAEDLAAMSGALAKLREVERVVAARGEGEDLRFLRLGNAHLLLRTGKRAEAVAAFDAFIRTLDPQRHSEWLTRANNGKGLALRELDRFDEADQAFADAVRHGADRRDAYEWVSAKNNRCLILHGYGKLAAARDCYAAVIPYYQEVAPDQVPVPMLNLAAAADTLGEPALALKNYRAALELRRAGKNRRSLGLVLLNLANYESQIGAWPDALEHSLEAQRLFEALGDKLRTVYTLNLRGRIYGELREPARARDYLEQALRVARDSKDPGAIALTRSALAQMETNAVAAAAAHREVAAYLVQTGRDGLASQEWMMLAERLDALGDTAGRDAALQACEKLLETNGSRSYKARAALLRSAVALRAGELTKARRYAQQAIDWSLQTHEIDGLSAARLLKARIDRRSGEGAKALEEIERALEELQRGEHLPGSPVLVANLYDRRIALLDEAMDILLGGATLDTTAMAKAWSIKWKFARAPDSPAPAPVDAEEHALLDELRVKVMLLTGAQTPGVSASRPPPDVLAGIAKRVDEIESQLDIRRAGKATTSVTVLDLPAVEAALQPADALISLNLGMRASGAWITTAQGTRWIALPARATLLSSIEAMLQQQDTGALEKLSDQLAPLVAAAGSAKRVMIVADGPSHLAPYAALRKPDGEYWIEHSSIELLARPPSTPEQLRPAALTQGFPVVVWGARDMPDSNAVAQAESAPAYRSGVATVELPSVSAELRLMKQVLGARRVSNGDPRTVAAPAGAERWVLHVAGHGLASRNHPYAAALALPDPDGGDGFAFVSGQALRLGARPPRIVFVNVCEGFSGRLFESQPPSSLARRFLQAGAEVVVAAAWPVEDSRAARFAERVYTELDHAPADIAAALARAQRESLRVGGARSWRHWAGYSVIRDER